MDLHKIIEALVFSNLKRLQWQCKGCLRMDGCEEQDGNAPKYCKEILKAAINEEVTFKYIDIKSLAAPTKRKE